MLTVKGNVLPMIRGGLPVGRVYRWLGRVPMVGKGTDGWEDFTDG